jgi:hypothetical protein
MAGATFGRSGGFFSVAQFSGTEWVRKVRRKPRRSNDKRRRSAARLMFMGLVDQIPNAAICSFQSIGRLALRSDAALSAAGWLPASMASTIVGARKLSRTIRETQESLTFSWRAMVAMSIVPICSCRRQARLLRSRSTRPGSGAPCVTGLPSRWASRQQRALCWICRNRQLRSSPAMTRWRREFFQRLTSAA